VKGGIDVVLSRREFLASSAALLAGEKAERTPVVDAHVHCFAGAKDRDFPYHTDAPYKPPEAATPKALLEAMDGAGVDYTVIVHPEPYQDDHSYLEHCLKQDRKRLKGTCLFFAAREDSPKRLAALAKRCSLVALRVHAYAPERQPPFGKPELKALWKQAADLGLAVQIHFEPRYAPGFEPYLKEFNKTTVIIDHLGRPFQGTPKEHKVVLDWAGRYKNAVMKVSALPEPEKYPHRKIAPVVKGITQAYGADRLIYGGGWGAGVSAKAYRAERERVAGYLAHLSAAERAAVLGGNAAKLFGFGP
jgi:predicted TIM-barrel fold metal-dependent hydrolase